MCPRTGTSRSYLIQIFFLAAEKCLHQLIQIVKDVSKKFHNIFWQYMPKVSMSRLNISSLCLTKSFTLILILTHFLSLFPWSRCRIIWLIFYSLWHFSLNLLIGFSFPDQTTSVSLIFSPNNSFPLFSSLCLTFLLSSSPSQISSYSF